MSGFGLIESGVLIGKLKLGGGSLIDICGRLAMAAAKIPREAMCALLCNNQSGRMHLL
jgi:hypothetical protein